MARRPAVGGDPQPDPRPCRSSARSSRAAAGGTFDVRAGAGVVADSVPASEYEETLNKAKALLKAVEIAQAGF